MPSPMYAQRVQNVLSVLAKNDLASVSYSEFVDRVRDSLVLDCIKPSALVDRYVRKALKRERLAARIRLMPESNKIHFTASGFRYYQDFGVLRILRNGDSRFERLTIAQLRKATKSLNAVLDEITGVLRANSDWHCDVSSTEDIPNIVSRIMGRLRSLGEQNTELFCILAENRTIERALQSGVTVAEDGASGASV